MRTVCIGISNHANHPWRPLSYQCTFSDILHLIMHYVGPRCIRCTQQGETRTPSYQRWLPCRSLRSKGNYGPDFCQCRQCGAGMLMRYDIRCGVDFYASIGIAINIHRRLYTSTIEQMAILILLYTLGLTRYALKS